MKKIKLLFTFILMFLFVITICTSGYATNINIKQIKEAGTTINSGNVTLSKKITNIENNEVTIKLEMNTDKPETNTSGKLLDDSEVVLLIDNSGSMTTFVEDTITRKNKIIDSTEALIKKINENNPNIKMNIISFSDKAEVIQEFTNNKETLISSCETFRGKKIGNATLTNDGLKLAKNSFTKEIGNKIIILLTDGIPNENARNETKALLNDNNYYIITALIGIDNASDTNAPVIKDVFGTEQNPTADKLYNIEDKNIEEAISNDLYNKILESFSVSNSTSVSNIKIDDYFSKEILNNFEIKVDSKSNGEITLNNNILSWKIDNASESGIETAQYTLKLKENYDASILGKTLNTNEKVVLSYTNNGSIVEKTMEDSPQISITTNNSNIAGDTTVSKSTILKAGNNGVVLLAIISTIVFFAIIFKLKFKKLKKILK